MNIEWHAFNENSLPNLSDEGSANILAILHPKMSSDDDHQYDSRFAMSISREEISSAGQEGGEETGKESNQTLKKEVNHHGQSLCTSRV